MQLLNEEFLSQYPDMPEHMNELSSFVFYRTYSRWLPKLNRRETWKEAVTRAVRYNVGISFDQLEVNNIEPPTDKIQQEAEILFDNIFNLRQFLSGRTHWVGGAEQGVANKFPLSNFNCSFINITEWEDLSNLFYLLLLGTGVGIKCTKESASNMLPIRKNYKLIHSDYVPLPPEHRLEDTKINAMENGYVKIYIGDSKEGWVDALRTFLSIITLPYYDIVHTIKISYNSIRPAGERLKTFGGTASGHYPIKEMFVNFDKIIKEEFDTSLDPMKELDGYNGFYNVRPIHILDMCNLIGSNVVVGGVRRTAEIFLCDEDDWECIFAKYGINGINQEAHQRLIDYIDNYDGIDWLTVAPLLNDKSHLHHRRMSNNSICFTEKPSQEFLHLLFLIMQSEGEPGFINLKAAEYRRKNARGINPCAEVLLDSYGTCNLTTVNIKSFIKFNDDIPTLDFQGLMQAQALSVRAAIRMTCIDLELHKCDFIQKRDRLIGASLTGWKDAVELLNYNADQEKNLMSFLREIAVNTASDYCYALRIPTPLLTTTIKPEGTLSQVAGGVSSGLHSSYAPFYIRRIRINANDPLAKLAVHLGWTVNPEIGTTDLENPTTLVIDFPVASNVKYTRDEQSVEEQLDTYFNFQDFYTEHNSSNTISVKPDEWDKVEEIVFERWDDLIGVTFFPFHGGTYELAPYEEITEEKYNELKSNMKPFDHNLLPLFENNETETIILDECEVGACPIR